MIPPARLWLLWGLFVVFLYLRRPPAEGSAMRKQTKVQGAGAVVALAGVLAGSPAGAQNLEPAPQGSARIAGGVGVLLTASLLGAPASVYLLVGVPGAEPAGIALGIPVLVALAVGIGELVVGVRELRVERAAARPVVVFGPGGLTLRF